MRNTVEKTGDTLVALIAGTYPSDAAFERTCGLPPKTVSNWRRGRSASYMKQLPTLADALGVSVDDLLAPRAEAKGMTPEEQTLLDAFRAARRLPENERAELLRTLLTVITFRLGGNP